MKLNSKDVYKRQVCSGVIDNELNGDNITAIPLDEEGNMKIGYIENKKILHSNLAEVYICLLYTSIPLISTNSVTIAYAVVTFSVYDNSHSYVGNFVVMAVSYTHL